MLSTFSKRGRGRRLEHVIPEEIKQTNSLKGDMSDLLISYLSAIY